VGCKTICISFRFVGFDAGRLHVIYLSTPWCGRQQQKGCDFEMIGLFKCYSMIWNLLET
jgi:hypothetical protein